MARPLRIEYPGAYYHEKFSWSTFPGYCYLGKRNYNINYSWFWASYFGEDTAKSRRQCREYVVQAIEGEIENPFEAEGNRRDLWCRLQHRQPEPKASENENKIESKIEPTISSNPATYRKFVKFEDLTLFPFDPVPFSSNAPKKFSPSSNKNAMNLFSFHVE